MARQSPDLFLQARDFFLDNIFPGRTRVSPAARLAVSTNPFLSKSFFLTVLCALAWFGAAACGLVQWGAENPWSQFDVFSVGALALLLIWSVATAHFHREMFVSREIMLEAAGVTFDKLMFFWIDVFAAAEVLIFFEYGHWHLAPFLRQPALQIPGIIFCVLGTIWLIYTDFYLSRQFRNGLQQRKMMNHGPYRFVRHPRYAGLIFCSVAIALAMASVIAWALAIGWFFVNVKRVELEDRHLSELFGAEYEVYASRTARFFPGVY